jgi:hypothetical protein
LNKKAAALVSGGLDSILAVRLMLDQGIEVVGLHFEHELCEYPMRSGKGPPAEAAFERHLALPGYTTRRIHLGDGYQAMVRSPRFGRGSAMNPCVDCHVFMLKKAFALLPELGASFIVTGEVLGQRPMSQHRQALDLIERDTGLQGLLLRPLCALNMEPTRPELEGVVDRSRLLDISGRGRGRQIEMAHAYGMADYPPPAGGCMLTERNFSERLKDAYARSTGPLTADAIGLLKFGRHYRLPSGAKAVLGRDAHVNGLITGYAPPGAAILSPVVFPGPSAVLSDAAPGDAELVASAIKHFSPKAGPGARVLVECGGETRELSPDAAFSYATALLPYAVGAS